TAPALMSFATSATDARRPSTVTKCWPLAEAVAPPTSPRTKCRIEALGRIVEPPTEQFRDLRFHRLEKRVELRIVAPILHRLHRMGYGRAVPAEQLGHRLLRAAERHMGEIDGNLAGLGSTACPARAPQQAGEAHAALHRHELREKEN